MKKPVRKPIIDSGLMSMKNGGFFNGVYEIAARIPKGRVATYGQIAAMLGNPMAARAVGQAMKRTPQYMDIPSHRVVNRAGEMAPGCAFGGRERQRALLEGEGVIFKEDGRVDMEKCIWVY